MGQTRGHFGRDCGVTGGFQGDVDAIFDHGHMSFNRGGGFTLLPPPQHCIALQTEAMLFADMGRVPHIIALLRAHPLPADDICIAERVPLSRHETRAQ